MGCINSSINERSEALLIFAARRDHLQNVIEPALARGDVVLCDRFTDATFAYQGSGRGFDVAVLQQLEFWVQALPPDLASQSQRVLRQPDVTVWFELDPAIAAERLAGARVPDRFESQPVDFFQKVSDGYAQRAQADPQRFVRLNAAQTRDVVWQQLVQHFEQRGWLRNSADTTIGSVAASGTSA